ncbi:sulfurtransferase complex subunit TusB [Shewanella sp. NIFS-20-20]|uniref:sulfurtransferase complex subunit TusB n=1 Tax=Shewanella sp. NIFS-20-20 TaxID=2853806 RepID=UPI001C447AAE|nr:sulfurtransferase complex subunit TusB [Shewanella sp. NIFS-20-20]MBV7315674.1 sulfurtransferase complex subunit TusB [Shewanella sp. NIFS-20-20]
MILHHIQTSPAADGALKTCLRYLRRGDSVLLTANAVNALLVRQYAMALSPFKIYVLKDDLVARGLASSLAKYQQIDHADMVDLVITHQKVITW